MKILWIILALLTVGLLVILAGAWSVFGEKLKAAQSVKKLEEGLYYLEYSGDYGFDAFLEKGELLPKPPWQSILHLSSPAVLRKAEPSLLHRISAAAR